TLQQTTYFRFTIPESQLKNYEKGNAVMVKVPYKDLEVNATIQHVKQIGAYANIASAYPDYDMQDPLYELIIQPKDTHQADSLLSKSTVTLKQ
ncbi:MAG: HlyD family secretion protein, partial [Sphingobacterium sp.]